MSAWPEGEAVVYCEAGFQTPNGKTAHGLIRRTRRYRVRAVIDSTCAGNDAGELLDGRPAGVPVVTDLAAALDLCREAGAPASHLVIGLAPDGGRLPQSARAVVAQALEAGLNVDSGLHDYLADDPALAEAAARRGVAIRDIRRPRPVSELHFFTGQIEAVDSFKVALLGTDSAVGKRTTAWLLVEGLEAVGRTAELVGTGQTAWLQGARFGVLMDCLINDFVSGEIEHAVFSAWQEVRPEVIVIEGQGSLMNPAYPGGFEILAAARPDAVILQHAPAREEYDGFPGYPIQPLERQIEAIELISGRPVAAVTINHERLTPDQVREAAQDITRQTGRPAFDALGDGPAELSRLVAELAAAKSGR